MFLPVLTALVVFYNFLYLPMQISVLSLLAAFALYGLTNNLVVSMIILVATPLLVLTTRLYKQNMDGFANAEHSAASVSERVKGLKKASHTEAKVPSGTLESPEIENFQNISYWFVLIRCLMTIQYSRKLKRNLMYGLMTNLGRFKWVALCARSISTSA
jgi:hypothetical protein